MGTGIARHQPEHGLPARLRGQALRRPLLAHHKGQGVKRDSVLQEHRPVGGDREIVQKGKTVEAVATVVQ